jgi:predicted Zn-dependent protease
VAKNPANPLARFGLANEALKAELWEEAVEHLLVYLTSYDDEGNGYGRLAQGLEALGRIEEARQALRDGMAAANRFGHSGLANELNARLDEMEETA